MKINPIMQTKVFNQRKPQNSLNGFSNPLFKQQSTQDVFEKQISFEKKFKILLSEDETDIFSYAENLAKRKKDDYKKFSCGYPVDIYEGYKELYNDLIYFVSIGRDDAVHFLLYHLNLIGPIKQPYTSLPYFIDKDYARMYRSNYYPREKRERDYLKEFDPEKYEKAHKQGIEAVKREFRKLVISNIENGTLSALKAEYDEDIDDINKIAAEYGIGPDGKYMAPELETPVKILDFDSASAEINQIAEEKREKAIKKANESTEYMKGTGFTRVAKAIGTVGISEIIRHFYYEGEKEANLAGANREIADERKKLDKKYQSQIKKREAQMEKAKRITQTRQKTEEVKEKAKQELQEGLINKINDFYKDVPVDDMPNCVMLVTPNPYIARELAYWTGDVTDTNFVEIPYNSDKNVIQEDLINELEHAEEEYQNTGRRSIIYAENMEDLINPEINEDDKIAEMKYFMQCADRNYHSTVIFSTSDPKKLWFEAIQPHRVGLKVRIPITVDEANVYKKESEEQ